MIRKALLLTLTIMACLVTAGQARNSEMSGMDTRTDQVEQVSVNLEEALGDSKQGVMNEEGRKALREIVRKDQTGEKVKSDVENLRPRVIRRTARTLALQKAVQWRYGRIQELLKEHSSKLDHIFDFSPLMLRGGKVLPPVISEAGAGYRVESQTRASSTDRTYRIVKEARMVSTPPSWRDYLLRDYGSFDRKDAGVVPQNKEERKIWKEAAIKGWELGLKQARRLFRNNLSELVRDYKGVLKFRILAEQNMVSIPVVAEGKLGIEVQGKRLSVDRQIFRITQPSTFQEVDEWTPKVGTN